MGWLPLPIVGLLALALSMWAAAGPVIPAWEVRTFRIVNGGPEWAYRVLWLPMQLGNLVVGTVVGLVIALVAGDLLVAAGVVLAMLLKLVVERVVRREMHRWLSIRVRPGTSQPGARLRGDVPASGPSFPSGHIILVAAVGAVVAPTLGAAWLWAPVVCMLLVMLGRVYVGAHNPLDVTAGLGAGLLLGGVLAVLGA